LKPSAVILANPDGEGPEPAPGAKGTGSGLTVPADLVTWSNQRIVEELIGNQRVAVAALCRRGVAGPEFLMNRNANYGGYFPIAARCRRDAAPMFEVREAIRQDTGYRPLVYPGTPVRVENRHFSPRFQCERRFVYSIFPVKLPAHVNLAEPHNELEQCLARVGDLWHWVPAAALHDPAANDLSPTIPGIREALMQIATQSGCA
jgi:hypothetical protein